MDIRKQYIYRHLLYQAMLDLRALQWSNRTWGERLACFLHSRESRYALRAAAIADWLHNLAKYSVHNFAGFNEEWFWAEHARLLQRFPNTNLEEYRSTFDRFIALQDEPFDEPVG